MDIQIIGVYPVDIDEPCHLIEIRITKSKHEEFDMGQFTQIINDQPQSNWQAPYDEHFLNDEGTADLNPNYYTELPNEDKLRVIFFFHYLELNKPLKTPVDEIGLPSPTEKPVRLNFVNYEPPY